MVGSNPEFRGCVVEGVVYWLDLISAWKIEHIKIRFNIVLPSKPRCPTWSLPVSLSAMFIFCRTCYMPGPCHSLLFHHPNPVSCTLHVIRLPINSSTLLPRPLMSV
jgi:hypothetical protein